MNGSNAIIAMGSNFPSIVQRSHSVSNSKNIVKNWRRIASLCALIVSITALAAAIFLGLSWWALGSLTLSVLFSAFALKMAQEWGQMALSNHRLETANLQFQMSEQRLNQSLLQIQRERSSLSRNIESQRQENGRLREANEETARANQNLRNSEEALRAQNGALTLEIASLHDGIGELRVQTQLLVERNSTFAQEIGVMHGGIHQVDLLDQNLREDRRHLNEAVRTLSHLIQQEVQLFQKNTSYLQLTAQKLKNEIKNFSRVGQELRERLSQFESNGGFVSHF